MEEVVRPTDDVADLAAGVANELAMVKDRCRGAKSTSISSLRTPRRLSRKTRPPLLDARGTSHYKAEDWPRLCFRGHRFFVQHHQIVSAGRNPMSRRCELSGKNAQVGHLVSHSQIKTKRRFMPNLCDVTLISDTLNRSFRLRISAHALRSVEHRGGLDAYLMKASDTQLSDRALRLKREIQKRKAAPAETAEAASA